MREIREAIQEHNLAELAREWGVDSRQWKPNNNAAWR